MKGHPYCIIFDFLTRPPSDHNFEIKVLLKLNSAIPETYKLHYIKFFTPDTRGHSFKMMVKLLLEINLTRLETSETTSIFHYT